MWLVDRALAWRVPFQVVADSGYGDNPAFLAALEARGLSYVCAVTSTFGVRLPEEVAVAEVKPPYQGREQPRKARPVPLYTAQAALDALPESDWQVVVWRQGSRSASRWWPSVPIGPPATPSIAPATAESRPARRAG